MSLLSLLFALAFSFIHSSPPTFDLSSADYENGYDESVDLTQLKEELYLYFKSFFNYWPDENSECQSQKTPFDYVLSIELRENLYKEVCERFKNCPKIQFFNGISGEPLGQVISCAKGRILFWVNNKNIFNTDMAHLAECLNQFEKCDAIDSIIMVDDVNCFHNSTYYDVFNENSLKNLMGKIVRFNHANSCRDTLVALSNNVEIFFVLHGLSFDTRSTLFLGNTHSLSLETQECFKKLPVIFGIGELHHMPWSIIFSS